MVLKDVCPLCLAQAFLFHLLRDADSRKGTLCPFCVPIHKKKKKKMVEHLEGLFILNSRISRGSECYGNNVLNLIYIL